MAETTVLPFIPREKAFEAGRRSRWHGEAPIASDGYLSDMAFGIGADLMEAADRVGEAVTCSTEGADKSLDAAEKSCRQALTEIGELRTRLAAVPRDFGDE